jgi:hypothetical protein
MRWTPTSSMDTEPFSIVMFLLKLRSLIIQLLCCCLALISHPLTVIKSNSWNYKIDEEVEREDFKIKVLVLVSIVISITLWRVTKAILWTSSSRSQVTTTFSSCTTLFSMKINTKSCKNSKVSTQNSQISPHSCLNFWITLWNLAPRKQLQKYIFIYLVSLAASPWTPRTKGASWSFSRTPSTRGWSS